MRQIAGTQSDLDSDIDTVTTGAPTAPQPFAGSPTPNFGFPLEAAFAQLEGYARHLVAQADDPHCKMQLERVRTAALDLAAAITSDMLNIQSSATRGGGVRRTSQPALIDLGQLEALLVMAGASQRDHLLNQLAIDLSSARDDLHPGSLTADKRTAACTAMSVAEAIGAQRAARLAQDLLDGVDQHDTRKCGIVAEMLSTDLAELIALLSDLSPAANMRPAE
ncbi:hypothetical protein [Cognatishimia sp. MH4019]|uniref:hypothetical protein n=1 Tax=Cognatishimia sp. MH4019 TaxID=2854030 RepID=UPI001CD1AB61|nr:hypothetical protein [Cognatishimia sp. MH4019]